MLGTRHHGTKLDLSLSAPPGLSNAFPRRAILPTACLAATLLATSFLPLAMPAHAAEPYTYWNGATTTADNTVHGGTGNWNTTTTNTNWTTSDGSATSYYTTAATDPLVFAGTAGTVTINSTGVVVGPGGLRFDTTGYTIAGSATNNLTITGTTPFNVVGAGTTATVSTAVITGAGTLVKTGAGTLILSAANTYTDGTILQDGRLQLGNASALNAAAGSLTMNGGTLGFSAAYTVATPINVAGASTIDTSTYAETLSGVISGNGDLTKIGTGLLTISGTANTYSGNLYVSAAGVTVSGSLGSGNTYTGNIDLASGTTLTFSNNTATTNQNLNGNISGTGTVAKSGANAILGLYGNNNAFTGTWSLGGGTVNVGSANALGGGTVTFTGTASTLGFLGNYTIANNIALNGNVANTFNTGAYNVTLNGSISGTDTNAGGLTKTGAGTLTLTGPITWTNGGITISAGTLAFNPLADQTVANPITGAGTLTKLGGNTLTLSGTINSPGIVEVDAGTLALTGTGAKTLPTLALKGGTFDVSGSGVVPNISTLNVYGSSSWNGDMHMENHTMNFYVEPGETMLTVNGAANITNSTVYIGPSASSGVLRPGDTVTLITATGGLIGAPINTIATVPQGLIINYDLQFYLDPEGNDLLASVVGVGLNPGTEGLSQGFLSGLAFLNQGADQVAGWGMDAAVKAAQRPDLNTGWGVFGTVAGGWSRYDTGSRAEVKGVSLMAGVAKQANLQPGNLVVGLFVEYGNGSYDTSNAFNNGDGDLDYLGGGIMGRVDGSGPSRFYGEASARAGGVNNDYNFAGLARYESSTTYYGIHAGVGYIWSMGEKTTLDLYGKYFWTGQQSDDVRMSSGEDLAVDNVNSERLRFGGRLAYAVAKNFDIYGGVAYEHEFDGQAKATIGNVVTIDAPSIKGRTEIGEFGLIMKPTQSLPLSCDLGVQGYISMREGYTGSLRIRYDF